MNCVIKQKWQDCFTFRPHYFYRCRFAPCSMYTCHINIFIFSLSWCQSCHQSNNGATMRTTRQFKQWKGKWKWNVVLVLVRLLLLVLPQFFFLVFSRSHCFSRKAHIREQRWMSYLFAHQIIGNFAFQRTESIPYRLIHSPCDLTHPCVCVCVFASRFEIICRLCIVSHTICDPKVNSPKEKHVHFRFATIAFFGGTLTHT